MLYFFLSYARGVDDGYVLNFFDDLCNEVRSLVGLRPEDRVGFLDVQNIQPGDRWPDELIDALSHCRVFLPLYSPAYFGSEPCGKEWAAFQERVLRHQAQHQTRSSALIPVQWAPLPSLPAVASPIQMVAGLRSAGRRPMRLERGVRQLLRLTRNRDDYLEFVTYLAELIVEAAADPVPEGLVHRDFAEMRSAFHPPAVTTVTGVDRVIDGVTVESGSDRVYFVVSAPTAETATGPDVGRGEALYYGDSPEKWAPYRPRLDEPLADFAARIAAQSSLRARVTSVDRLDECLEQARRNNQVVVILVDAWSIRIPENQRILYRYDQRDDRPAAVMIPFSSADAETQEHAHELAESVRRTFPRNMRRPEDVRFRRSVLTHQSFDGDLQALLEVSRNRIFADPVIRRPIPPSAGERPILEGP